jgi:hypothetical protein
VETYNSIDFFVAIFRLTAGWYIDYGNSEFSLASSFQYGQNGVPSNANDWSAFNPNPNPNSFQLVVGLDSIDRDQSNCFSFAARISVVRTNFLGGVIPASRRTLWIYNSEWNVQGSENFSPSPFTVPSCWTFCPPDPDTICTDLTPTMNCRDLVPDVSSLTSSAVTYDWSTGATSSSINVCPDPSLVTYYTVTITETPSREPVAALTYCMPPMPPSVTVGAGVCARCETSFNTTFYTCNQVTVQAGCKDLSNIRIGFSDCTTIKFDGLSGRNFSYTAPANKEISAVWVKAGCKQSGECPGCGLRVDNPYPSCQRDPNCAYTFN